MDPVDYFLAGVVVMFAGICFVCWREKRRELGHDPYQEPWS